MSAPSRHVDNVVAIDVGGTKIAAAVVTAVGAVLAQERVPTKAHEGADMRDGSASASSADVVAGQVRAALEALQATHPLPGGVRVGIGSAGPIDARQGTVSPVNIPGWRGFPLVDCVRETVHALTGADPERIELAGDGPCIALGEQWRGAGRGHDDIIGVICSTGVGAGLVVDGQIFAGETGNATLVGHTSVNAWGPACPCGGVGCVENYACGPAMVRRAHELGWEGDDAIALTSDARTGDERARQAIDEGMRALAAGLAALAADVDIATVVVGGGVAKAGDVIFTPLRRHFDAFITMAHLRGRAQILPAELDNAGLLGAAKLVLG